MRQKYDCQLKISTRSLHKTERPSVKVLMPGHVIEAIKQNGSDTVSLSLPFFDKAFPKNKLPNSIGKAKAIPNESLQQMDSYFIGMALNIAQSIALVSAE